MLILHHIRLHTQICYSQENVITILSHRPILCGWQAIGICVNWACAAIDLISASYDKMVFKVKHDYPTVINKIYFQLMNFYYIKNIDFLIYLNYDGYIKYINLPVQAATKS